MNDLFVSTLKEALEKNEARRAYLDGEVCLCGSTDAQRSHHQGDTLAPECDFWECGSCGHQWGHE